jgi:hypothetical protein
MSLDIVELIVEIEEQFGVTFTNRDAERMCTVGDVYQFVLHWRSLALQGVCVSSATFYRARRALCSQLGLQRQSVGPASPLDELLPAQERRGQWQRFRAALEAYDVPNLRRPLWLRTTFYRGGLVVIVAACLSGLIAWFLDPPLALAAVAAVLLAGLSIGLGAYLLTIPLAVCVPAECGTMRGLVGTVLGGDRDKAHAALERLSEREIWDQLCQTIGTQLGVDPALLTPQTSFADVLGG